MIPRYIEHRFRELLSSFPVVFLTGPRQSGKTTLARHVGAGLRYFSLEDLMLRDEALTDPRSFLKRLEGPAGVVLDEVQHVPDLFSYLQQFVDEKRARPVVLTGSQHFLLSEKISQSLAGRAAILELMPLSLAELLRREARKPDQLRKLRRPASPAGSTWDRIVLEGLFPRIHDERLDFTAWLDGYLRTYVERDLRVLARIGDLDLFTRFVRLCAGRAGQLVNFSSLASDAGISHTTASEWLSLLRNSYICEFLQPFHRNYSKRLVRTPKLYFCDTGLLCYLLGIRTTEALDVHPLRGAVFENFVVAEFMKLFLNCGERPPLYFWRDNGKHEVDLIIDLGTDPIPIEIKSGATIASDSFKSLDYFVRLAEAHAAKAGGKRSAAGGAGSGDSGGILVYGGDESHARGPHQVWAWHDCS